MGHMINRQSHAFSCNSGNNCTQKHVITYTNYASIYLVPILPEIMPVFTYFENVLNMNKTGLTITVL